MAEVFGQAVAERRYEEDVCADLLALKPHRWILMEECVRMLLVLDPRNLHGAEQAVLSAVAPLLRSAPHAYRPTTSQCARVLVRDGGRCVKCGRRDTGLLEVDHLFPRSKGGCGQLWNMTVLCRPCNRVKGDSIVAWAVWRMIQQARKAQEALS